MGTASSVSQLDSDRGGKLDAIYSGIAAYYSAKANKFGPTPLGVDWTCQATQEMRFVQLLKLCDFTSAFSLNDLGWSTDGGVRTRPYHPTYGGLCPCQWHLQCRTGPTSGRMGEVHSRKP